MKKETNPCKEIDVRPFAYAISLVDGKWKMHILFWLWKKEILRYSEIKRALGKVTHKMLSSQLKELENDNLQNPFLFSARPRWASSLHFERMLSTHWDSLP